MKLPGRKEGHSGGPGWSKLLEKFVKLDKIKIDDCKEDIDTLLVLVRDTIAPFHVSRSPENRLVWCLQ